MIGDTHCKSNCNATRMSLSSSMNSYFFTSTLKSKFSRRFMLVKLGLIPWFNLAASRMLATASSTRQGARLLLLASSRRNLSAMLTARKRVSILYSFL